MVARTAQVNAGTTAGPRSFAAAASTGPANTHQAASATRVGTPSQVGQDLRNQMSQLRVGNSTAFTPRRAPTALGVSNRSPGAPVQTPVPGVTPLSPSEAPSPSVMTTPWRNPRQRTESSLKSVKQASRNAVCKLSNFREQDYRKGDVISAPFHAANTNPNVNALLDSNFTMTKHGGVYSKRRMMVVLYTTAQDVHCVPLFSWSGRGVQNKPQWLLREYVCMKNAGDTAFVNHGLYEPVVNEGVKEPLSPETTVVFTGTTKVSCVEDVTYVGRLTRDSYFHLMKLWKMLVTEAQNEPWTP